MARFRLVLAVLVTLFAVLTLLDRFVLIELLVRRCGIPLLFATVEALACIGVGVLARRTTRVDVPLDLLIGYPIFGTLCFLVGAVKVNVWTMVTLVAVGAAWGATIVIRSLRESGGQDARGTAGWKPALR